MKIRRDDLQDLYPLSPMQEGMLFHARQEPRNPAYTEQVVWHVSGHLDVPLYQAAWDDLHHRYEALRSVFTHEKSREPLQLVLKERRADFQFESLADLPADVRERMRLDLRAAERAATFDLAHGPLLRVRVYQLGAAEYDVILTWHHILLDGWSTHLMLQDLFSIYAARAAGSAPTLTPLPSYARYVEWLKTQDREDSLAYWRELLSNYEAPADIPRLVAQRDQPFALESVEIPLDQAMHHDLHALAAANDATVSSAIQAAWGVVLGRYCDTHDVVFGAVVSGRSPDVAEVEGIAGLLINTIPVRVAYDAGDAFATLVRRLQRQSLDSQPHHASRLAEVQQQTELRSGLIKQLVVFENYPAARADTAGIGAAVQVVSTSEPTTYDLVLVAEPGPSLRLTLQYNSAAYPRTQMTRLAVHVGRFLRSAVARPDAPLVELEMLDQAERESLQRLNATARDYPSASTLAEQFAKAAHRHATRTAIVSEGAAITYEELDQRSNRLAHHLAACGVGPGDRVATVLDRSTAMVEAVLAIVKLGACYVPHDPSSPPDRLTFAVEDAGIRAVIALATSDVRVPNVTRISPDADAPIIATRPSTAPPPPAGIGGVDEAMLFYTSGSTGTPKAVRVPHRAVLRLVLNTDYVTLGPADRVAHMSNVAFDAATFEIWGALLNGAEVHPFGKDTALTPHALSRELRSRGITTLFVTTALFNQIAREAPDAFATLDTLLFGGELVDPSWVKRVVTRGKPKRLLHVYGPTETCTFATWHEAEEPGPVNDGATIPIGRPIANTTAYVVDRDMRLQPLGAAGELLIGGDGVGLGYHARPDLSAAAFVPDPFGPAGGVLYRTGDIVRRNLDGDIEFIGRRDSQVKLRGFRIELGEVETALRTFAGVTEALVIAHQDEASGDRRLVAYLSLQSAPERTIELALRNHLRLRLPGYMIPSVFVILERFPLNANGKLDRHALPPPTRSGMGFGRTFIEPVTELEKQLAKIWETTLGVPAVGRTDNFFELGGHSLTASTAISHIRAELKVDVPIASFFQSPTLEALALHVAALHNAAGSTPTRLTRVAREAHRAPEAAKSLLG